MIGDIESGFGIGGHGSDDHNLWSESEFFELTETTPKIKTRGGKCELCGEDADYNPSAGMYLCVYHWDEY